MVDSKAETNPRAEKIIRLRTIAKEEGKCEFCPPHKKENRGRTPRPDHYKNHRNKKVVWKWSGEDKRTPTLDLTFLPCM